jgi:hypothetical protein
MHNKSFVIVVFTCDSADHFPKIHARFILVSAERRSRATCCRVRTTPKCLAQEWTWIGIGCDPTSLLAAAKPRRRKAYWQWGRADALEDAKGMQRTWRLRAFA